ncbi:hypothetical protein [Clostridium botulinum]|nr:hypothetical protein [Clostridium botulinum]MCD3350592.1 hypothetical protein [Clostridium botulinum D/C]MCD3359610.1 hypothetical protein [Clostridium botulinum D/C]MCD3361987.1 hypothetical protein [Clostridium botulinum D/C]MCD3365307.1 hypothetical protein [Clostridium botulinum D/C]QPW61828.1 hypothetical protein IG390_06630 [Clostridium botulinum]
MLDINEDEKILEFYNSNIYESLEQENTKLWYEGVNYYLYHGFQKEKLI